jgi:nucleoside-diphosphate-sugar epimerase
MGRCHRRAPAWNRRSEASRARVAAPEVIQERGSVVKVFLTGATGYIGSAVAEALQARGHEVWGLARSPERAAQLEQLGVRPVRGDLADPASLAAGAREAGAVIHTAMAMGDPETPQRDRAAVEAMLDAIAGQGKAFVYTSGVWVVGPTFGRVAGELSPLLPPKIVAWRPAVERLVLDAAGRGVRSVVLRPGMVFGRRGGFVAGLMRQARQHGVVKLVRGGENHMTFVHVDDLANLYALAAEQAPAGELFLAVDKPAVQVKQVAEAVCQACGREARIEDWPLEEAEAVLGPMAAALAMDQRFASTKAARVLHWFAERPSVLDEIRQGGYSA